MILAVLGAICLIAAVIVALRWLVRRYDALGRRRSFPLVAVAFLGTVGVASLTPLVLRLRLETKLEAAASEVAGKPVQVHCQALGEAFVDAGIELGYVRFGSDGEPEPSTLIKRQQCADLSSYVDDHDEGLVRAHVVAVHTLTHEAIHMSGVRDESETECLALQHDAEMARLLGASESDALALAAYYWREIYPRMPDGYRSDNCTKGGTLDENLPGAPWG